MEKIWKWINTDGLLHIESCALIVILCDTILPLLIAILVSLFAGIAKEIWDIKHGVPTWHDIICDLLGIGIGALITII